MNGPPIIRIENLHKRFGPAHVLRGINLSVMEGEVVVLVGPSGAGKSTLLRCLNRLEDPSEGQIFFQGVDITGKDVKLPSVRRNIGMIFQHFNLFPHMTAIQNVMEGLRTVLKVEPRKAEILAMELLTEVGVQEKAS